MRSGFEVTCLRCNFEGAQIANAIINKIPYTVIRCPQCEQLVGKQNNSTEWKEIRVENKTMPLNR